MNIPGLTVTVDRIEQDEHQNEIAVLVFDDGQQLNLPLSRLPEGVRAGTVLTLQLDPDHPETERRLERVKQVQSRLFGRRRSKPASENRESQ